MAREPAERVLEELYRVRDGLDEAARQLHEGPAEGIVASLSSLRTASLSILQNYTSFVETLDRKTQQAPNDNPLIQAAVEEIHHTCTQLIEVTSGATQSQNTIDALRREEAEQ